MNISLSVQAAKQLIEFISKTNYQLAPAGDGNFSSKDEALAYVDSAKYDEKEPLSVCFDTRKGDYWESAVVSFNGSLWFLEDYGMGGKSSQGRSIQEAITAFRLKHDPTSGYCPVELTFK